MAIAGTPRSERLPNQIGSSPSCAAAMGTCPISSVQPLSAPSEEINAPTAIKPPAQWPHMAEEASAKGEDECASCSRGITPITVTVPST